VEARTPAGFRFAAKFPRLITQDKKLEGALGDAEAFVGTMQALGDKLGVRTLQRAHDFTPDHFDRLEAFLRALPQGPRCAVEVRNRKWLTPGLGDMLSTHNVALVLQDLHYMPESDWITAEFTVIRWLGRRKDIQRFDHLQIGRTDDLKVWTERVERLLDDGVDVYGYFDNHFAGHSPASVRQFGSIPGCNLREPGDENAGGVQLRLETGNG
jgi:uncharacterized protein YecE (DUF72 family)